MPIMTLTQGQFRAFRVALAAAPLADVREYLNGVAFFRRGDGVLQMVGTTGMVVFMSECPQPLDDTWGDIILKVVDPSRGVAVSTLPAKWDWAEIHEGRIVGYDTRNMPCGEYRLEVVDAKPITESYLRVVSMAKNAVCHGASTNAHAQFDWNLIAPLAKAVSGGKHVGVTLFPANASDATFLVRFTTLHQYDVRHVCVVAPYKADVVEDAQADAASMIDALLPHPELRNVARRRVA